MSYYKGIPATGSSSIRSIERDSAPLRPLPFFAFDAEPLGLRVAKEAPLGEELLRQRGRAALLHAEEEELGELVALEAERVVWHSAGAC